MNENVRSNTNKSYQRRIMQSKEAVLIVQNGRIVLINGKAASLVGQKINDLDGKKVLRFVHREDRFALVAHFTKNEIKQSFACRIIANGQDIKRIHADCIRIPWGDADAMWIQAVEFADKEFEEKTAHALAKEYETVFQGTHDAMFLVTRTPDQQFRYVQNNKAHARATGIDLHMIRNKTPKELVGEKVGKAIESNYMRCVNARKAISYEETLELPAGKRIWHTVLTPVFDDDRVCIVGSSRDITKRKQAEEMIRKMSYQDSLTGLYNRRYLEERMRRMEESNTRPLALIMGDVNGLKLVNDTFGHDVGDQMLQIIATELRKACGRHETIGRWGGDEFFIMSAHTDDLQTARLIRRIEKQLSDATVANLPISVSFGFYVIKKGQEDLGTGLQEAEDHMYRKKVEQSKYARNRVLDALLQQLFEKSWEDERHVTYMTDVALRIGRCLGLADSELARLRDLVRLHDIGKIHIPKEVLNKKEALDEQEWAIVKLHPHNGCKIVRAAHDYSNISEEVWSHHERWDGTGYPRGIKKDRIPLLARITAVADAYDVMKNGCAYKQPMSDQAIQAEFVRCAGRQFDPEIVKILLSMVSTTKTMDQKPYSF